MERCRNHRRKLYARSCPSITIHSAKDECFLYHGVFKGKSSLMIFERHANLKYKFGNRKFWATGYYVSTVGLNAQTIQKYIREQDKMDQMEDSLFSKEYEDPFKGSK